MGWLKTNLRNSLFGRLPAADLTASTLEDRTDEIRQVMLAAMGEFGEKHYPKIVLRVRYAQDPQALWYARGDVMAVMAALQGETAARQKVYDINDMFRGLLPSSLGSRQSSLVKRHQSAGHAG
jgi:hypothetical protein